MAHNKLYILRTDITTKYYTNAKVYGSGVDIHVPELTEIPNLRPNIYPMDSHVLKSGIRCEFESYDKPSGFWLVPRSSISNTPLIMANSIGLIDAEYRGELLAKVYNLSTQPYRVIEGTRLFQIVAPDLQPIQVVLVDELSSTERGSGGFGSTGK